MTKICATLHYKRASATSTSISISGGRHSSWSLTGDSSYSSSQKSSVCTPCVTSCGCCWVLLLLLLFLTEFVASLLRLLLVVLLFKLSVPFVVRRFNSTTMGSGAFRNTWTASSCGKLLTSIPFTCKQREREWVKFNYCGAISRSRARDKPTE